MIQPSPSTDDNRAEQLGALADGLAATVQLSRVMAEARRRVELTGLDGRIGLLCAQALDLPPALGAAMVPRLSALLAEIDALETAIAAAHGPPSRG